MIFISSGKVNATKVWVHINSFSTQLKPFFNWMISNNPNSNLKALYVRRYKMKDILLLKCFPMSFPGWSLPDSKVHGANMGPIWGWQNPGGPHVVPMNFAIWAGSQYVNKSAYKRALEWPPTQNSPTRIITQQQKTIGIICWIQCKLIIIQYSSYKVEPRLHVDLTKSIQNLAYTVMIGGVLCEHFGDKWPYFNGLQISGCLKKISVLHAQHWDHLVL